MEVSTDIMFMTKVPFLVILIKGLKFTTIEYLLNKLKISFVDSINKIISHHKSHILHVHMMFVDLEFQFLKYKVFSTVINTTGTCD